MPLALVIIAVMLIVVGIKGNYAQAGALFNQTFFSSTSSGGATNSGFFLWFGSILGIAVLFRLIQAPKAGEAFIALLILVYFLKNNNVLSQIESSIQGVAAPASASSTASTATTSSASAATVNSSTGTPAAATSTGTTQ